MHFKDYSKLFLLLLVAFSAPGLQAQTTAVKQQDSLRVIQLVKDIKSLGSNDSAVYQTKVGQAALLIRKHRFPLLTAELLMSMAYFNFTTNNFAKSEKLTNQVQAYLKTLEPSAEQERLWAKTTNYKAVLFGLRGEAEKEQQIYLEMIPYYRKKNDSAALETTYYNLGNVFFAKDQYDKALHYFQEAYHIRPVDSIILDTYTASTLAIAMAYNELKDTAHLNQYLNIAFQELSAQKDSSTKWGMYYHLRGQYEILRKNYREAIVQNRKGVAYAQKIGHTDYINNNKGGLATSLYELKQYKEALQLYREYYAYTRSQKNWHFTLVALKRMADINFRTAKYRQAYQYLNEYIGIADSIKESQITQRLHGLEAEFQAVQKENKIKALQHENERKDWKLKQNKALLLGSVIATLLLIMLAFLLYRSRKNQKKIHLQERQLHQHEISRLEQEHQISMLSSLMQGTETERQRLGRDLHDGLGGLLSGIKLKLNSLKYPHPPNEAAIQQELKSDLDHVINEMRNVSQSLLPDILQQFGIAEALRQFCARLSSEKTSIQFQAVNFESFPDQQQRLILYRVAQELINNAVKHAHAREILVQLQQSEDQLFLTVEDDGIGYDKEIALKMGSGLANLRHRIGLLKGTLECVTAPGEGCSVYITCPVPAANDKYSKGQFDRFLATTSTHTLS